jgi:glycosyltransferase involved in cell wall biosynthesis
VKPPPETSPRRRRIAFIVPGSLETRTGGYEYDRRIVSGLRARGWAVDVHELSGSFPHPTTDARDRAARQFASLPMGTLVLADGLALGSLPELAERDRQRLRLVALVHLPLADAVGLERATASMLERSEARVLACCRRVIVTGASTVTRIERYGVARERVAVVEPGTDVAPLARGSGGPSVHLVCVAAVTRGKGHEILIDALAQVPVDGWTLICAGSLERDRATVERVRASLRARALGNHVSLAGELDAPEIAALYDRADVFVLATLHETYGMAVAEALARGLPVVSTATGAIADLVGDHAGIVVPPGDVDALAEGLKQIIVDGPLRARCADGARRVRDRLPTWDGAVDKMTTLLETIAHDGPVAPF